MIQTKKKIAVLAIVIFALLFLPAIAYYKTGVFSPEKIDQADKREWEHNQNGLMPGQGSFSLEGQTDECWLLIHSYTATPDEMRELAHILNETFEEYVLAPRLKGHAKLPSDLEGLSLQAWYKQVEEDYLNLTNKCERVNVAGSSIGGLIGVRLAEEHEIDAVYAVNSFFNIPYNFYYIWRPEEYVEFLGPYLHYVKKNKTGQIADPVGREEHFSYLNMPLEPIIDSKEFFLATENNLDKIKAPFFMAHSTEDPVSSLAGAQEAFASVSSQKKRFLKVSNSKHILLRDHDKEEIIAEIIKFEESLRE